MNTKKQYLNDKLQKNSILFLQLGLVLALFLVYSALEFETIKKKFTIVVDNSTEPEILLVSDRHFTIERKVEKIIETKPQPTTTHSFTKTPDDTPNIITVLTPSSEDIDKQIEKLPGGDVIAPEPDEDVIFAILEDAPIFPGCEGLKKEASKKCFTKEISKFVNKKFNADLAADLNLNGKQKIWVQFKIDKTGTVTDIIARAAHKNLEKEAIRVVEKLPQMTPGKQRGRSVGVKYTLPIKLIVE